MLVSDCSLEDSCLTILELFGRNEAGILTARKDLDYIGREELLEALERVNIIFFSFMHADNNNNKKNASQLF